MRGQATTLVYLLKTKAVASSDCASRSRATGAEGEAGVQSSQLEGKVALVTGSSRGIGKSIAQILASEGCDVVVTGRDTKQLDAVASEIRSRGRKVLIVALDLVAEGVPQTIIDTAVKTFGRLDILVNNAGSTKRGEFLDLSDDDWHDGFELKFFAHVRLARAAWPALRQAKGSMVTIGGTSGRTPHAAFGIGSSVNAACAAFTKALADLGKSEGVQVNCIHPSHVETERLWRRLKAEIEKSGKSEDAVRREYCERAGITRFGKPEDVAELVAFIVSSRGSWLHGATIDLDGGEIPAL